MPRPSNRDGSGVSREALVAITDAKPRHRRRTGADARASWSPTDRIIFEPEREAITGYKRQWYYEKEKKGECPRRIKLGARRVGWLLSELEAWVRERAALRDGSADAEPDLEPDAARTCPPARKAVHSVVSDKDEALADTGGGDAQSAT